MIKSACIQNENLCFSFRVQDKPIDFRAYKLFFPNAPNLVSVQLIQLSLEQTNKKVSYKVSIPKLV